METNTSGREWTLKATPKLAKKNSRPMATKKTAACLRAVLQAAETRLETLEARKGAAYILALADYLESDAYAKKSEKQAAIALAHRASKK